MKEKMILGAGLGVAGILTIGAGLVVKGFKKKQEEEKTLEFVKENVELFMKNNKVSKYDLKTLKFIKKFKLNGKELSDKQIEELLNQI